MALVLVVGLEVLGRLVWGSVANVAYGAEGIIAGVITGQVIGGFYDHTYIKQLAPV